MCNLLLLYLFTLRYHYSSVDLVFLWQRSYICPVDDCHSSYRRKDHLNRHLLQHEGKLFQCPNTSCNRQFVYQGNMKRHIKEFHGEDVAAANVEEAKEYVCPEVGCGKVFKYASKLRKHEESHGMFVFQNFRCLYQIFVLH